jgi:hypothetical protein
MTRTFLATLASGVLACAGTPGPPPGPTGSPSAAEAPASEAFELSGRLSRKGPDETSHWAVTDGAGKAWQIVETTPGLEARFRKLQNGQVTLRVERRGRLLLEQVWVLEVLRPPP